MRIKPLFISLCLSAAVLAVATSATAESHTHDGFLLQFEIGPGYLVMPGNAKAGSTNVDWNISGMAVIGGLFMGGTPFDGFVIGAGMVGNLATSPKHKIGDHEIDTEDDFSLGVLGPFVQYYPDPTSGLNFRLLLGYATASGADDDADDAATGFGLAASVGHDWWVGEEWSMGLAGRFTYAHVTHEFPDYGETVKLTFDAMVPGVVFTVTYH
jgi:hypothetical protein